MRQELDMKAWFKEHSPKANKDYAERPKTNYNPGNSTYGNTPLLYMAQSRPEIGKDLYRTRKPNEYRQAA